MRCEIYRQSIGKSTLLASEQLEYSKDSALYSCNTTDSWGTVFLKMIKNQCSRSTELFYIFISTWLPSAHSLSEITGGNSSDFMQPPLKPQKAQHNFSQIAVCILHKTCKQRLMHKIGFPFRALLRGTTVLLIRTAHIFSAGDWTGDLVVTIFSNLYAATAALINPEGYPAKSDSVWQRSGTTNRNTVN